MRAFGAWLRGSWLLLLSLAHYGLRVPRALIENISHHWVSYGGNVRGRGLLGRLAVRVVLRIDRIFIRVSSIFWSHACDKPRLAPLFQFVSASRFWGYHDPRIFQSIKSGSISRVPIKPVLNLALFVLRASNCIFSESLLVCVALMQGFNAPSSAARRCTGTMRSSSRSSRPMPTSTRI